MRILLILMLVGILVISGCSTQEIKNYDQPMNINNCEDISKNFDEKINNIFIGCEQWDSDREPLWVGGTLIEINSNYDEVRLNFEGFEKQGEIYIKNYGNKTIPYEINQFYRFDLNNVCGGRFSAASSGAFYDPDFTALEIISC